MRGIQSRITEIASDPFLTVGEKNAALMPILLEEAEAHRLAGDAALEHAKKNEALALTFSGSIRANLIAWVNQFGTVAQQLSNTITGVLNTAIAGTAQAITGLIFQTKSLGQASYQIFQSIIQQIIQMGIQMVVNAALGSILRRQATQEQVQSNLQVGASAVPTAIAQSGATSGSNWVVGAIAAGVAIAAIIALMSGAFEEGGFTGYGGTKSIAGVVHGGEFVQPDPTVRKYGLPFMEALRVGKIPPERIQELMGNISVGIPRARYGAFEEGGSVSILDGGNFSFASANGAATTMPPAGNVDMKVIVLNDVGALRREILNSSEAELFVVNAVNGRFHQIRKRA